MGNKTRVLIIGFGPSGIVSTHYFAAAGDRFDVTTVEASSGLGGVWNPEHHYPSFRTNNSRNTWELPDLRHKPGSYDDFPTQAQVNAYLREYVAQFELEQHVQYNTRVERLVRRRASEGEAWEFELGFSAPVAGSTTGVFDFVVVASGFTYAPKLPAELADTAALERPLIHSFRLNAAVAEQPDLCEGKRVVVIGGSKSAIDLSVWAASEAGAASVDMIAPTLHWSVPRYFGDDDPEKGMFNENVLYSRFAEWRLPVCLGTVTPIGGAPSAPLGFYHLDPGGQKLRDAFWAGICADIVAQFQIPEALIPKHDFMSDAPYLAVQHPEFFPLIAKGSINVHLARANGLAAGQVQLSEGEPLDCDLALCATGFGSSWGFLDEEIRELLFNEEGQAQLFRNVYNPDLPQLAFLGAQFNTNWMLTAAVASRWIVELAKGEDGALHRNGVLADDAAIREVIKAGLEFEAGFPCAKRGMYTTGTSIHPYIECLMAELGAGDVRGRYANLDDTLMGPLLPARYAGLATQEF